ncbi:DUF881 domain-containing protein [Streptomyces sp. MAR4 CNY-716]
MQQQPPAPQLPGAPPPERTAPAERSAPPEPPGPPAPPEPSLGAGRRRLADSVWPPRLTRSQLIVALLLFVLGLGLAIQVRSTGESSALRGARQEDLVRILDELDDRTQRLEDERERLEDQKAELENSSDQAEEARRQTEAKERQLGVLAGTVAAEGPGIEITVRGPEGAGSEGAVEADMLLDTIQELRAAGAEAIQINGVRVVAGTHFADSGENDVAIDGRTVSQPYVFRVIGRAEDLEPALNIPGGVVQTMEEEQATVSIEPRDTVLVDALRREKRPDYARSSS